MRMRDWKLVINGELGADGSAKKDKTDDERIQLFNLEEDIGEKTNLAGQNPDKVKQLLPPLLFAAGATRHRNPWLRKPSQLEPRCSVRGRRMVRSALRRNPPTPQ